MQFRLRTLLILLALLPPLLAWGVWWQMPIHLTGTYADGTIRWKQTNRRRMGERFYRASMVRYYPDGRKSYEYRDSDGVELFWSPSGEPIGKEEWIRRYLPLILEERHPVSTH